MNIGHIFGVLTMAHWGSFCLLELHVCPDRVGGALIFLNANEEAKGPPVRSISEVPFPILKDPRPYMNESRN